MEILPIAYFPPLSYFSLLKEGNVILEAFENYQKQSWRNRCLILTANGVQPLSVPVVHSGGTFRHGIKETIVDYSRDFVTLHCRALDAAYMSAPYFTHYRDSIYAVLNSHPDTLWELDLRLMRIICKTLGITTPGETSSFLGASVDISPKRADTHYKQKPYYQVFISKTGAFVPNLSILDLLFNEGPGASEYL